MSDIRTPPSVTQADSIINLSSLLEKVIAPEWRESVVKDIKNFHALNETEAKKYEEAKAAIKKNEEVLEETRKGLADIAQGKKVLADTQDSLGLKEASLARTATENLAILAKAEQKHKDSTDLLTDVAARETALKTAIAEHQANLLKYEDDKKALEKKRQEIEDYKQSVIKLDEQTKAKVEALKKFNF